MKFIYKITYPNGKIYIGKELTDDKKVNCKEIEYINKNLQYVIKGGLIMRGHRYKYKRGNYYRGRSRSGKFYTSQG